MNAKRANSWFTLSTLVAVTGVNPITFNSWRKRNGLFPWTLQEKGWKYYSLAEICVVESLKNFSDSGFATQFAVNAATALLPHYEAMQQGDDEAFGSCVAVVMQVNHGVEGAPDQEVSVDLYDPKAALADVLKNRASWGSPLILNLFDVFIAVVRQIRELEPEVIVDGRIVLMEALIEASKPLTNFDEIE